MIVFRKELAEIAGSKITVSLIFMQPLISMAIFVLAAHFTYGKLAHILLDITIPPGGKSDESYSAYAASAVLPLILFWVTMTLSSLSVVGESVRGTLGRIRASGVSVSSLIVGKMLAFTLLALGQALILIWILAVTVKVKGGFLDLIIISLFISLIGVEWGLLYSGFSSTEVQAIQLVPPSIIPQILLCGVVWPRKSMDNLPQMISNFLPMTYAVDAFRKVIVDGASLIDTAGDLGPLSIFVAFFAVLNLLVLKRRLR